MLSVRAELDYAEGGRVGAIKERGVCREELWGRIALGVKVVMRAV